MTLSAYCLGVTPIYLSKTLMNVLLDENPTRSAKSDILISGNEFSGIKDDSIVKFGAGGTHQKLYNVTVPFENNTYENTAISDSITDTGAQKDYIVIDYAGLVTVS